MEEEKKKTKKKNADVERLELEKKDLYDKVLRLTAEMQNMNKRFELEKSNIYKYDGERLIKELLPILDNFERALSIDSLSEEQSKFLSGFKMIYTSLLSTLNNMGVKEIEAKGAYFNPESMEAIMTTHIEEEDTGIVIDVLQKGYTYNDKVIRVAMCKVNE